MRARVVLALSLAPVVALACGNGSSSADGGPPAPQPVFPQDYTSSYKQVRNCRQSADHDLNFVRILASPSAYEPYENRDHPFPEGAVVLKEEYDFGDSTCSGPIKQWTAIERLAPGSSPKTLDWRWQQVDAQRDVLGQDVPRCYGCHTICTPDAGGYENTCAMP